MYIVAHDVDIVGEAGFGHIAAELRVDNISGVLIDPLLSEWRSHGNVFWVFGSLVEFFASRIQAACSGSTLV